LSAPLSDLLIASKSAWDPPIRREHQLAMLAAGAGHAVSFIERPSDVRALRGSGRRDWLEEYFGGPRRAQRQRMEIVSRATLMPAHLHRLLERGESRSLKRAFLPHAGRPATAVATLPWHWPAIRSLGVERRVLDVADDWTALLPARAKRILALYRRAADQADAIVVVSESLSGLFPGRSVEVVRNGVDPAVVVRPQTSPPGHRRLLYLGTLSERFDSPLAAALLDALPEWTLDLYGGCAYARHADQPSAELRALLDRRDGRARWHGPIPRTRVAEVLDAADVLVLLNRALSRGQDSMKIYDYSARARPVVANEAALHGISERPPHLAVGSSPADLADLIKASEQEPDAYRAERVEWARAQAWGARWSQWAGALFGHRASPPGSRTRAAPNWPSSAVLNAGPPTPHGGF
jgi:hypothetical protein